MICHIISSMMMAAELPARRCRKMAGDKRRCLLTCSIGRRDDIAPCFYASAQGRADKHTDEHGRILIRESPGAMAPMVSRRGQAASHHRHFSIHEMKNFPASPAHICGGDSRAIFDGAVDERITSVRSPHFQRKSTACAYSIENRRYFAHTPFRVDARPYTGAEVIVIPAFHYCRHFRCYIHFLPQRFHFIGLAQS